MASPQAHEQHRYRFAPLDRGGFVLGLGWGQCAILAVGVLGAGAALDSRAPAPAVLLPIVVAVGVAFGRVAGGPAHEWLATVARWTALRKQRRWYADLPLTTQTPALPPFMDGLAIVDAGPLDRTSRLSAGGFGVVVDRARRTVSASLRVSAREFSLLERAEQERLLQGWGDALAGFCAERSPVCALRWTEWTSPSALDDQIRYLDAQTSAQAGSAALASYRSVLADIAPRSARHDTLITITVDQRRLRRVPAGVDRVALAIEVLAEELRLLTTRLEVAGTSVDPPLSPNELAEAIRLRCDPGCAARLATRSRSLAALAGVVSHGNAGPLVTEAGWSQLRIDGAVHRTYWMSEWPRADMPADWLEPLLLHGGAIRTVSLLYEPVAPSRSARQVERDATRLATDEEQRARSGFRVGARHRRAASAVAEREAELIAGYAELAFAGFVTVR